MSEFAHEPAPARADQPDDDVPTAPAAPPTLSRRRLLRTLVAGGGAALLAACQPPAPARPAASGAPSAPAAPAAPAAAGPAGWERQWDELIAAARQEGRVVVGGPASADLRLAAPAKFKERFGVEMEYLAFPPNQGEFIERIARERAAGLVTVDAFVGGAQSIFTAAYPQQIMAPIRPALVHPEALDETKWRPGRIWFKDPDDTYFMQVFNQVGGQIAVNTDSVRPDEIKGYRDLLKPSFTGKISVWNPTLPGTGWNTANWLRLTFGDDFFKQLYVDQKVGIPEDARQWSDWLARGTYPIALGASARDVELLKRDGFHVEVLPPDPEAPGIATGAFGIVVLIADAPHPNAAKLFVNWMAMREGQETWGRADQIATVRTDVDNSWAPSYTIPRPDLTYLDGYDWNYVNTAFPESIPKIRQIMAQRQ
ncbi:MAG TPA: extracellular solute-binding protein [Chloroflexota bacterium]|nr:extracellular solute-binding protein [Chloroflexota bacterium]